MASSYHRSNLGLAVDRQLSVLHRRTGADREPASRLLQRPRHEECEVAMSTDTFSSVGYGFPGRMPIKDAIRLITQDLIDAISDELTVGYLWSDEHSAGSGAADHG